MKKIGITLRQDRNKYGIIIDSVEEKLSSFISSCGFHPVLIPNLPKDQFKIKNFTLDGYILSGGTDLYRYSGKKYVLNRENIESLIIKKCMEKNLPLLGICRGMQFINHFFGGKLSKSNKHAGTRHYIFFEKQLYYPKKIEKNSYHNFVIKKKNIGQKLTSLGSYENCTEFFKHKKKKIFGIMWHPEREKAKCKYDKKLIKKIFK